MRDSPPSFLLQGTGVLGELRLDNLSNVDQTEGDLCWVVTTHRVPFEVLSIAEN